MPRQLKITAPDGRQFKITAPDDATDEQIHDIARQASGVSASYPVANGGEAKPEGDPNQALFNDIGGGVKEIGLGALEGAANVADHGADWLQSGLNAAGNMVGAGAVGDKINSLWGDGKNDLTSAVPKGVEGYDTIRGIGRFGGETVASAPLAALRGGAFVQGAVGGALLSDKHDGIGVGLDAIAGGAGGKLADMGIKALSRVVNPVVSSDIQNLIRNGVQPTSGQIAGSPVTGRVPGQLKRFEDLAASVPIAGAAVKNAQSRATISLNRAAINRALLPIGEPLAANSPVGHEGVRLAGDRLSAAYSDVLPRLNGQADATFGRRIRTMIQRADLPPGHQADAQQVINEALKAFRPVEGQAPASTFRPSVKSSQTGDTFALTQQGTDLAVRPDNMPSLDASGIPAELGGSSTAPPTAWHFNGRRLRDASERLGDIASSYRASDNPYTRVVGGIADQARSELHALARRQNPADASRLRDIDRGYASLVRVERAARNTPDGVFTASQYDAATRGADKSARGRASARGQALDQDLSAAAKRVMGDTASHGGSKDVNSLVALGVLGTRAASGDPLAALGIGAVGLGSAAYSGGGQNAIRGLLTRTPGPSSQKVADLLRYGSLAAPIAAPAAIETLRR